MKHTTMSEVCQELMGELKTSTQGLHDSAELHPFQGALAQGGLSRREYGRYLAQLLPVHRVLEQSLAELAQDRPDVRAILWGVVPKVPFLESDLATLSSDQVDLEPTPSTSRLLRRILSSAAEQPIALLGHLYVLEGSMNGAKFIARNIRRLGGGACTLGTSYLDPYGDDQRSRWQGFKERMNQVAFDALERRAILDGAVEMFQAVIEISDELNQPRSAIEVVQFAAARVVVTGV